MSEEELKSISKTVEEIRSTANLPKGLIATLDIVTLLVNEVEILQGFLELSRTQCRRQMLYPAREVLKNEVLEVLQRYGQERPGHPVHQQVDTALSWYQATVDELEATIREDRKWIG